MWTSCPGHYTACTVVLRQQPDAIADSPPPPLTAAAAEFHLTPQTIYFFSQSQLGRLLLQVPGQSVLFPSPHASLQRTHQPPPLLLISQHDTLEAGLDDASDAQLVVSEQRTVLVLY